MQGAAVLNSNCSFQIPFNVQLLIAEPIGISPLGV
jgi:hypothetical protein